MSFWRALNPDRQHQVSPVLLKSPIVTDWTYSFGESGLVLLDKARHSRVVQTLTRMLGPELLPLTWQHAFGDKETYWQSMALSDTPYGMNALSWTPMGTKGMW